MLIGLLAARAFDFLLREAVAVLFFTRVPCAVSGQAVAGAQLFPGR